MTSDEKMVPGIAGGKGQKRPVGFIGGPCAGQARIVPEGDGNLIKDAETGFVYKIWPFKESTSNRQLWLAFEHGRDPLQMLVKMWEEYSISAQIRGGDHTFMNRIGKDIDSRT